MGGSPQLAHRQRVGMDRRNRRRIPAWGDAASRTAYENLNLHVSGILDLGQVIVPDAPWVALWGSGSARSHRSLRRSRSAQLLARVLRTLRSRTLWELYCDDAHRLRRYVDG